MPKLVQHPNSSKFKVCRMNWICFWADLNVQGWIILQFLWLLSEKWQKVCGGSQGQIKWMWGPGQSHDCKAP